MNLKSFRLFRRPAAPKEPVYKPARAQTRDSYADPYFSFFNAYQPLKHNIGLYTLLRGEIPFINVAILKLVKLIGDPMFEAENESIQGLIDDFVQKVKLSNFGQGLGAWLDELEDSTFETGMGWAETVLTASLTDVAYLKIANPTDIRFIVDKDSGLLKLATLDKGGWKVKELEHPELVYYLAFDRRKGHPQGYSLVYSCVFPAQIFIRWEKSFDNQVQNYGDFVSAIMLSGGEDSTPSDLAMLRNSILDQMAIVKKLRKQGQTADIAFTFPKGGSAAVKTLGYDAKFWQTDKQVRTILEQLVANTGLLPVHLGLSWSARETQSKVMNDIMMSNIETQRKRITPIVQRVIDTMLMVRGFSGASYKIMWPDIMLQDETERAKALKWHWEGIAKMLESLMLMIEMGMSTPESAEEMLAGEGLLVGKLPKNWFMNAQSKAFIRTLARTLTGEN